MKRVLLLIGSSVLYAWDRATSLVSRVFGSSPAGRRVVLVYHNVTQSDREPFARQAALLKKIAQPCTVESFLGATDVRRRILITFDDAYESIFENALPALNANQIPCIVFVPVGWIDQKSGWQRRSADDNAGAKIASPELLRQAGRLVALGAHGVRHVSLLEATQEEAQREINDSRAALESLTAKPVTTLAFPYGHYNDNHLEICRRSGYATVFAATPRWRAVSPDGFLIYRTPASPRDWPCEFFLKIRGAYRWHGEAARLKQALRRRFGSRRRSLAPGLDRVALPSN